MVYIKIRMLQEASEFLDQASYEYMKKSYGKDIADNYAKHVEKTKELGQVSKRPGDDFKDLSKIPEVEALALTEKESLPSKTLKTLALHESPKVKRAVASHINTDPHDLLYLAKNGFHEEVAAHPLLNVYIHDFEKDPISFSSVIPNLLKSQHFTSPDNKEAVEDFKTRVAKSKHTKIAQTITGIPSFNDLPLMKDITPEQFNDPDEFEKLMKNLFKEDLDHFLDSMNENIFTNLKNKLFGGKANKSSPTAPTEHPLTDPAKLTTAIPKSTQKPLYIPKPAVPIQNAPKRNTQYGQSLINDLQKIQGVKPPKPRYETPKAALLTGRDNPMTALYKSAETMLKPVSWQTKTQD